MILCKMSSPITTDEGTKFLTCEDTGTQR